MLKRVIREAHGPKRVISYLLHFQEQDKNTDHFKNVFDDWYVKIKLVSQRI